MGQGFNTFRIPFLMERISPPATGLTGPFDSTYLGGLQTVSCIDHRSCLARDLILRLSDCQLHHRQGWLRALGP